MLMDSYAYGRTNTVRVFTTMGSSVRWQTSPSHPTLILIISISISIKTSTFFTHSHLLSHSNNLHSPPHQTLITLTFELNKLATQAIKMVSLTTASPPLNGTTDSLPRACISSPMAEMALMAASLPAVRVSEADSEAHTRLLLVAWGCNQARGCLRLEIWGLECGFLRERWRDWLVSILEGEVQVLTDIRRGAWWWSMEYDRRDAGVLKMNGTETQLPLFYVFPNRSVG